MVETSDRPCAHGQTAKEADVGVHYAEDAEERDADEPNAVQRVVLAFLAACLGVYRGDERVLANVDVGVRVERTIRVMADRLDSPRSLQAHPSGWAETPLALGVAGHSASRAQVSVPVLHDLVGTAV